MSQGWRILDALKGILLIATLLQGITPDPVDLASSRALLLICPILGNDNGLQQDDGSPFHVCEPLQPDLALRCRQTEDDEPVRVRALNHPSCQDSVFDTQYTGHNSDGGGRSNGLIRSLCRFLC
jgi:hypothetical protein